MDQLTSVGTTGTKHRFRHVNFAEPAVEVERRADGTVVLRSPRPLGAYERNIIEYLRRWSERAPGYLKRPDLTAAMFDEEGFYKIGDAGRFIDPADSASVSTLLRNPAVIVQVREGLRRHNARNPGSSTQIRRVILMAEPPSIDGNEITDKGYINQAASLERRADLVARLFANPPAEDVIIV